MSQKLIMAKRIKHEEVKVYRDEAARKRELRKCQKDLFYLGRKILGYEDAEKVPHQEMCDFIDTEEPYKLLVGTRGIFKTSFCTVGRAIQLLLRDSNNRILVPQNTFDNARLTVGEMLDHFNLNDRLRQLVPDLIPTKVRGITSQPWSSSAFQLNRSGIFSEPSVTAAGVETQLARRHFNYILGDDVVAASRDDLREDGVMIIRPEEMNKAIAWYKLIMHGLQILTKNISRQTKAQFIVNRWGAQDFAQYILDHQQRTEGQAEGFVCKIMGAHREDGSLLWPGVLTEERLESIRRSQGDFMYYAQYECMPRNPKDAGFPVGHNTYWKGVYPPGYVKNPRLYKTYALIDLADHTHPANCNTAFVLLWVDEQKHIWVGEAIRKKIDTNGKIKMIHKMVKDYDISVVHIEENLYRDTLEMVLKDAMKREGLYYRIGILTHKNRNKDGRILRLQPHHVNGALHIKKTHRDLRHEMRDFGYTDRKDIVDALGYIMDFIKKAPSLHSAANLPQHNPNIISLAEIKNSIRKTHVYGGGIFPSQNQPARIAN